MHKLRDPKVCFFPMSAVLPVLLFASWSFAPTTVLPHLRAMSVRMSDEQVVVGGGEIAEQIEVGQMLPDVDVEMATSGEDGLSMGSFLKIGEAMGPGVSILAVSYTHLTLPTKA